MLTESELELARRVAAIRSNPKVDDNHYKVADRDSLSIHFDGARAEVACSKILKFPVDISFYIDGDKKRPDLYAGDLRVEIKACTHTPPIVKFNALTDFVADVLIVCFVHPEKHREAANVEVWGCISRRLFMVAYQKRDFGYGDRATITHEMLSPLSKLLESKKSLAWIDDYSEK